MQNTLPLPTKIQNITSQAKLEIDWENGEKSVFSYEFLRVHCPCAGCQGHTPDQAKTIVGKEKVKITMLEQAGNYAVRIAFDDNHDTGIYTFERLYRNMQP